ncbi:methanol dehydrogenase [Rhodovulum sp. BSW8]|uniref:Methanol dehydrogenase n=1 Tax=Rhodovulum visakhapatnamense TaxID=364297 RepID=A0ABS1RFX4_9RHOB|nr:MULTISPECIES: methanol dehydrogenase [Rhodovulum]MBL3569760.1 methanol dehydrogenase [Rhodovulum visakhapatnamense]MBL3577842.1 methanol dehydrogenase [Rhodovulum visakhapatnamense]OLS42329.1 methanol dehydrogenase [Rhodovulum sulfidophilum]RBO53825.1 methanol dehydrogenase [Rhodovulum sp. BSW8]
MKPIGPIALATAALFLAAPAFAYDGTNCKAPGNCWEPKPGYPDKVAGSKYDPQHDPAELSRQGEAIAAMEQRNAWRVHHFRTTGSFEYNVRKIPGYDESAQPPAE